MAQRPTSAERSAAVPTGHATPVAPAPGARREPTPAAPGMRRPPARARRRGGCGIAFLGLLALVLLIVTAGLVSAILLYRSELIPAGLQTLGVPLGGQTRAAAAARLQAAWDQRRVVVDLGTMQPALKPEELGITLDVPATVHLAYDQARSSAALEQMLRSRELAVPASNIEPVWKFDPAVADRRLQALARQVYVPAADATIEVIDGRVETTQAREGRALDVAASGAALSQDPWGIAMSGRFKPVTAPVAPRVTDLSPIAKQVEPLLQAPVSLHLYDPILNEAQDWQIAPQVIGTWITIKAGGEEGSPPTWGIDGSRVQGYLAEQAGTLGAGRYLQAEELTPQVVKAVQAPGGRITTRIYHQPRQHTVKSGETFSSIADDYGVPYPWIQAANPGVGEQLRVGQAITVPAQDALLPLVPVENKRIVVSLSQQKMWAYENGAVKWEWPASTGMASSPTAPGIFQIQTHETEAYAGNWDLWMPYFMGVYRPVPNVDFMNGFHGFPRRGPTQILWTKDLGRRVTYGCILISTENSKQLYSWADEGTVVEIKR